MNRIYREYNYYTPDPDDFKMPYSTYTKTDLEVMQAKYFSLENYPKHYLTVRYSMQWLDSGK